MRVSRSESDIMARIRIGATQKQPNLSASAGLCALREAPGLAKLFSDSEPFLVSPVEYKAALKFESITAEYSFADLVCCGHHLVVHIECCWLLSPASLTRDFPALEQGSGLSRGRRGGSP